MAIRVRRGNEADFDESKMLPGEWAVSLDTRYVRMCFAPGVCLRMATYEGFESDMERVEAILAEVESIDEAIKAIQKEVQASVKITVMQKELASEYAKQAKDYAKQSQDYAQQAKESADRAAEITDIGYGSADRAGIVAPQDIYVDPSNGHMELIATASASPLQNSYNGGLRFTEMIGASEQNTTTGTQLARNDVDTTTNYGLTVSEDANKNIVVNGTTSANAWIRLALFNTTAGKEYTVSCNSALRISVWDRGSSSTVKTIEVGAGKTTFTASNTSEHVLNLSNVKSTTLSNVKADLMVNEGSEALPWEKYSGGKPAPNPDYPQEIKSVSISGMKTHGNQLFDKDNAKFGIFSISTDNSGNSYFNTTESSVRLYYVSAKPNTTYTFSKTLGTFNRVGTCPNIPVQNGVVTNKNDDTTVNTCTITTGVNDNYIVFYPLLKAETETIGYDNVLKTVMINEGNKALPYESFQESVVTPTGFKLNAIGNVKDRLVRKDGVWQIERKVKSYTFTGNESGWNLSSTRIGSVWISFDKLKLPKGILYQTSLCSHFPTVTVIDNYTKYGQALVEPSAFNMWMKDGTVSGESEVKEFLANRNVTFLYVMETPTYEVLPLADQVALNSLLTFDGTTYLDIESVLEPQFALEYGTSKVGGYTLQSLNTAEANQARIVAMETVTNNMAAAVLQGEE